MIPLSRDRHQPRRDLLHLNTEKANSVCTQQCLSTSGGTESKVRNAKRAGRSPLSITGLDIKINPCDYILFVHLDFCREKILNRSCLWYQIWQWEFIWVLEHLNMHWAALEHCRELLLSLPFLCPPRPSPLSHSAEEPEKMKCLWCLHTTTPSRGKMGNTG